MCLVLEPSPTREIERYRERRFYLYEEAPGFRPGPRVQTRAQALGDRFVLFIVKFPSQPSIRDTRSRPHELRVILYSSIFQKLRHTTTVRPARAVRGGGATTGLAQPRHASAVHQCDAPECVSSYAYSHITLGL